MTRARCGGVDSHAAHAYGRTWCAGNRGIVRAQEAPRTVRTVTLYGTLHGPIWAGCDAQLPITVDLVAEVARDVSRSGMVAAIRAAVDGAGDFISAKLTADSFILVEHRRIGPPDGTVRSWARRWDVCDLPSLADYVDADAYALGPED